MVDCIIHNARITTQFSSQPKAEALAVHHGRIAAVGSNDAIKSLAVPHTKIIDVGGAAVIPGLTDAHIHFHDMAWRRQQLSLYDATSLKDLLQRLRAHCSQLDPGDWALGYGWREVEWPQARFPTRHDLDPITGSRPTLLWRTDLHAAVANTAALQVAGIGPDTPNPAAGVIDRDERGDATGVLRELAINLVRRRIPPLDEARAVTSVKETAADLHRLGIVGVHDQRMKDHSEEGPQALRLYTTLRERRALPLRITCNVEAAHLDHLIALGLQSGFGDEWVQLGHVKLFADGSLGAGTAWMLRPYEDDPANTGMYLTPPVDVHAVISQAHHHGLAVSIHAIGDRAMREVLDIFSEIVTTGSQFPPLLPHRIEHVQTIDPADVERLAALQLTASVQPLHCSDDMVTVDRRWGRRGANTYVFRQLLRAGTRLAFGSDAPVANPNPWLGIYAAHTRQRPDGFPPGGWYPEECLTVAEAVYAYTLGAAAAVGQSHQQGRIAPGYVADVVAVDRDIFSCEPADLVNATAVFTMVGGTIVYNQC